MPAPVRVRAPRSGDLIVNEGEHVDLVGTVLGYDPARGDWLATNEDETHVYVLDDQPDKSSAQDYYWSHEARYELEMDDDVRLILNSWLLRGRLPE